MPSELPAPGERGAALPEDPSQRLASPGYTPARVYTQSSSFPHVYHALSLRVCVCVCVRERMCVRVCVCMFCLYTEREVASTGFHHFCCFDVIARSRHTQATDQCTPECISPQFVSCDSSHFGRVSSTRGACVYARTRARVSLLVFAMLFLLLFLSGLLSFPFTILSFPSIDSIPLACAFVWNDRASKCP